MPFDMKEYRDRSRKERFMAGLCIMCGKEPKRETSKLGQLCHEKSKENQKKRRERRIPLGLCSHCTVEKAAEGRRLCKKCNDDRKKTKEQQLAFRCANYGITTKEYHQMIRDQGNSCAICGCGPTGRWNQLDIDHCHETGKVRGLLCHSCNKGIGCLKDDPEIVKNAVKYLAG